MLDFAVVKAITEAYSQLGKLCLTVVVLHLCGILLFTTVYYTYACDIKLRGRKRKVRSSCGDNHRTFSLLSGKQIMREYCLLSTSDKHQEKLRICTLVFVTHKVYYSSLSAFSDHCHAVLLIHQCLSFCKLSNTQTLRIGSSG